MVLFNPIAQLIIPIGIPTKEAKAGMETHPLLAEIAMNKCSKQFKTLRTFLCFLLINSC